MKRLVGILCLLLCSSAFATEDNIHKFKWDNLEVVWLQDERFPTYDITIYFADGSLSDARNEKGVTDAMFALLPSGTRRFDQRTIADHLEYYGVTFGGSAIHEQSTYSVSGLVKDIVPTMKKICHLFKDATYPKKEIVKEVKRARNSLKNLITDQGSLASRAFRELSLAGTPVSYPSGGKLNDLKKITQKKLVKKLKYFNEKVKKRIYVSGPKGVLEIRRIINEECGWKGQAQFVRSINYTPKKATKAPSIYLVTVPKANQAQVRIGRFLNYNEIDNRDLMRLSSSYLGGGFTSRLIRELRVKRGLTYSAGSVINGSKYYGRSAIITSTNAKTLGELLNTTKTVLDEAIAGNIKEIDFKRSQGKLAGSSPFRFEKSSDYLDQLMNLDHLNRPYSVLYDFPEKVRNFKAAQVSKMMKRAFNWNEQTIVIVGPKSLKKQLQKFGKVKVVNYKKFL